MPGPPSAFVGQPPLTADDKLIIRGWQVLFGMGNLDPAKGLKITLKPPPPGQPHESNFTSVAVACAIGLTLMTLFTGTRLFLRASNKNLKWGWDDWVIILGTVCGPLFLPHDFKMRYGFGHMSHAR
ncbi:MAG: hypothetical protein Q9221_008939 [Calogaya cf. arnoldii]